MSAAALISQRILLRTSLSSARLLPRRCVVMMPKVSMAPRPIQSRLWMSTKTATQAAEKKAALDAAAAKDNKADSKVVARLLALARPEAKSISGT